MLSLVVLLLGVLGCASAEDRVELTRWSYRWGDSPRDASGRLTWLDERDGWRPMELPGQPPSEGKGESRSLWMRTTIPAGDWRDAALQLDPLLMHYEAYLDGERIDRLGDVEEQRRIHVPLQWRMVSLPDTTREHELTLRFSSTYWLIGIRGRAFVSGRASHQRAILTADLGRITGGLIAIMAAVFAVALALHSRRDRRLRLSFAAYAAGIGGYTIFYTKLKDLILDAPGAWEDMWRFAQVSAAVGIVIFVVEVFGSGYRGILDKLWKLHLGLAIAHYLFVYTVGFRSQMALDHAFQLWVEAAFRLIIFCDIITILAIVVKRAFVGDRDGQIFLAGISLTAISTLREVAAVAGLVDFNWDSWTFVGTLTFLAALVLIAQRRHDAEIRRYEQDKTRMLKDLHDGIGGITSNIGLLAAIAARDDDKRERLLEDIAELSREGMAELRSLLDTLDTEQLSWERLVKQLRHLGSQTLAPHDIGFVLESDVAEGVASPSSFAYVHIVRTYREALTNVIKHASANEVRATLEVRTDTLELRITDDGVGIAEGNGDGRGLSNMHKRAAALGGDLTIAGADEGATIALRVPLPIHTPESGVTRPPDRR